MYCHKIWYHTVTKENSAHLLSKLKFTFLHFRFNHKIILWSLFIFLSSCTNELNKYPQFLCIIYTLHRYTGIIKQCSMDPLPHIQEGASHCEGWIVNGRTKQIPVEIRLVVHDYPYWVNSKTVWMNYRLTRMFLLRANTLRNKHDCKSNIWSTKIHISTPYFQRNVTCA